MICSIGLVVSMIVYAIQVWFSYKFFKRSRQVKDVSFLTKKLVILGNVAGLLELVGLAFRVMKFLMGLYEEPELKDVFEWIEFAV